MIHKSVGDSIDERPMKKCCKEAFSLCSWKMFMEEPLSYNATIVTPLCKALSQGLDARFTLVGLVERSSPRMETCSTLYNTLVTLSNGLDFVIVCLSLPQWESHPKCLKRGDILVCRNCRRQRDGLVLKLLAGHWVLVNGEETAALPRCLSETRRSSRFRISKLSGDWSSWVHFPHHILPQAYLPRHGVSKLARAVEVPFYFHLGQLFFATLHEKQTVALDAVQVTILWPFHESFCGAVVYGIITGTDFGHQPLSTATSLPLCTMPCGFVVAGSV
jgi:hypothetical protein